jgi:secreted Zn-dependent insulinase-like peptidase
MAQDNWSVPEMLESLNKITETMFIQFVSSYYTQAFIEGLVEGSLLPQVRSFIDTRRHINHVIAKLQFKI